MRGGRREERREEVGGRVDDLCSAMNARCWAEFTLPGVVRSYTLK